MDNKLFYEQRPYIYAGIAVVAFVFAKGSKLGLISGWILLGCAVLTLFMRFTNRKRQVETLKKHNALTEKIIRDKEKNRL
jgi:hypothetical protein